MIIPERLALVSTLALGKSSHPATDTPTDGSLCGDALAPTVAILQASALDLVGRMIAVTE